ncbi:MAG: histidine--tRNA ligase [Kiritimatiellae bacterium]|nr:histidine--tRNA ligase [Kiritimatiellia bacterium]
MSKKTISFAPPRGMRDFYPEDMRLRNRVFEAWHIASASYGFQPYDACVVESLELLQRKSGEEVSEQIYHFEDKSGRKLALRPEMTPTLARMIVARQGRLTFPIKWYTTAQCFRYERMTRGRKREHYQWNMDIIGEKSISAEIEVIAATVLALKKMGLPEDAYYIHINNRALLAEMLEASGIPAEHHAAVFLALDKRGKISDDEIKALLEKENLSAEAISKTFELLAVETIDQAAELTTAESPAIKTLRELFQLAEIYGIKERLLFDISIIRGLAYYTGIVFEAFDAKRQFRAIFGGGRYDSLLTTIGGAPTPAVGLGFGDVVIMEVLKEYISESPDADRKGVIIGYMFPEQREAAMLLANSIRSNGEYVNLMLKKLKPKQFFARAGDSTAADAIFLGPDDIKKGIANRKNLTTREQIEITLA